MYIYRYPIHIYVYIIYNTHTKTASLRVLTQTSPLKWLHAEPHAEASIREEVLDRDRHRDETGTWSTDTMQFQVGGLKTRDG